MKKIILSIFVCMILILLIGCTQRTEKAPTGLTVTQFDINGKVIRSDTYTLNSVSDLSQTAYQLNILPKRTVSLDQIEKTAVVVQYDLVFTNIGESYALVDISQAYFEYYTT